MTIQSQIDAAASGSVVTIAPGTYNEGVIINKPLTLRCEAPVYIKSPPGMAGIRIGANFVTIDGPFDIVAPRDDGIEGNGVHHAVVRGVTAHDCGESGIQFNWSEFITIENCRTYKNASLSWYSGISVYQCREIGGAGPEPRTIIRNNICYDNFTGDAGAQTDGNGIIVDDMNSTQDASKPAWKHQTLVEGNLCFRNGSKGIAVAWSDFTTVRGNTCFGNNGDLGNPATWRGDISLQSSRDCTMEDNLAVCDPGTHASSTALGDYGDENVRNVWRNNMAWPANRSAYVEWNGVKKPAAGYVVSDPQMPGTSKPKQATGSVTFDPADWLPANPAAAGMGWRPSGVVTPEPKPEPEPEPEPQPEPEPTPEPEPNPMDQIAALQALAAALDANQKAIDARLAALEARPTDPEIAIRITALETENDALKARVVTLEGFDKAIKDLG